MHETLVTFVVTYHNPEKMNQPDVTRHFATLHQAETFVQDLDKIAPKAHKVHITKITTKKERIS